MSIDDLLNNLEGAEKRFIGAEFLAPVIGAGGAAVRIAGVVCRLTVTEGLPRRFHGWAILRARSTSKAAFVREARLAEVSAYLRLFPAVKLVLVHPEGRAWWAVPASRGDTRFQIKGLVGVQLAEAGLERFETIVTRFDGRLFWYEKKDPGRDPSVAAYLRDQLSRVDPAGRPPEPDRLHKSGLTREEREAYALVRALLAEAARSTVEVRLAEALAHAGAELRSFVERAEAYVVTYVVDGRQHISTVQHDDLTVVTAGICLAGQDRRFDLASLVGVLREGERQQQLVWIGEGGLNEERYWQIHPPDAEEE